MRAEIIAVGDEILRGGTPDTNSSYLAARLTELGIEVYRIRCVGDDPALIARSVKEALKSSALVITSGGLGPTEDDVTLAAVSRALGKKLITDKTVLENIKSHFRKRRLPMPPGAARQALVPEKSLTFPNRVGTAPGIILKTENKSVVLLPGPPAELKSLLKHDVIPYLRKLKLKKEPVVTRAIKTIGISESLIHEKIIPFLRQEKDISVGSYPHRGEVKLELSCRIKDRQKARKKVSRLLDEIRQTLGEYVYGFDEDSLESAVARLLLKSGKTVAVAESATGGLIGHRLTSVPGSSRYFPGGVIAYSNQAKIKELGVPTATLKEWGAVSRQVAIAMAAGVRKSFRTNFGIGITGICGPGGGSRKKPVGLVYVALVTAGRKECEKFRFVGERPEIKFRMSQAALNLLRKELINE